MNRRTLAIVAVLTVLALVFAGCAASSKDESTSISAPQVAYEKTMVDEEVMEERGFGVAESTEFDSVESSADLDDTDSGNEVSDFSEKIIYNVYTSVQVEDVQAAVNSVTQKVKSLGGYISYSNMYNSGGYSYANVEIRVPSQNLSKMEEYTYMLGEVEEYTMNTDNITESYYDIKSRLESAEKEEAQLIAVLEKAETVEDILLVRDQLSRVQEKIESYKGKMRLWDSLVDYSTVTYNIRPIPTLDNDDDSPRLIKMDETWRSMKKGFKNSAIAVANFFSLLFSLIARLFFHILILGAVAVVIIVIVKKRRKSKKQKEQDK